MGKKAKVKPYRIEDGVTQSLLSSFISCRVRTRYTLDRWERIGTRKALSVGTLVHGVLEDYCTALMHPAGLEPGDETGGLIHKSFARRAAKELPNISSAEATESFLQTAHAMEAVTQEYAIHWGDDRKRKWFALEEVFDVQWEGFRLRGKVDGAFLRGKKDAWLFETKTSGQIREDELSDALSFDFQSLYYLAVLQILYPQYKWKGCLYNIIRKPQLRQKKGETIGGFMDRIQEDVHQRPEFYLNRFELVFPAAVQREFREQLRAKLTEFASWLSGDLPTYRNESACRSRWSCDFLPACAAGGPGRPDYVRTRVLFSELQEEGESSGSKKSNTTTKTPRKRKAGRKAGRR